MNTSIWTKLAIACAISGGLTTSLTAQSKTEEVEIIDKNGQTVQGSTIVFQTSAQDGTSSAAAGSISGGISVKNENGRITILDASGKEHVIETPGAQSVTVTQSGKTVVKDGQKHTENVGKAIVIGPNGERQEIIFSGEPTGEGQLANALFFTNSATGAFMIGVGCSPIPESLASQLKLDTGLGLLVESVSDDSPASVAGLQKHDILMFANETGLKTIADLMAAVEQAGADQKPLSLTLVRAGKEMTVEATPTKRPANEHQGLFEVHRHELPLKAGLPLLGHLNVLGGEQLDLQQAGPGIVVGSEFPDAEFHEQMQAQMEEMKAEMERMKKMFEEQKGGK